MREHEERNVRLTLNQAQVLVLLTKKFKFASASKIAKTLGWSEAHARRILGELKKMGLTDSISAGLVLSKMREVLGIAGFMLDESEEEIKPRTKLHFATITFEQLKEMYPDIDKIIKHE